VGPATIHFTVTHNGKGNNALRLRTASRASAIRDRTRSTGS
jgi:hypothetical protein